MFSASALCNSVEGCANSFRLVWLPRSHADNDPVNDVEEDDIEGDGEAAVLLECGVGGDDDVGDDGEDGDANCGKKRRNGDIEPDDEVADEVDAFDKLD